MIGIRCKKRTRCCCDWESFLVGIGTSCDRFGDGTDVQLELGEGIWTGFFSCDCWDVVSSDEFVCTSESVEIR